MDSEIQSQKQILEIEKGIIEFQLAQALNWVIDLEAKCQEHVEESKQLNQDNQLQMTALRSQNGELEDRLGVEVIVAKSLEI